MDKFCTNTSKRPSFIQLKKDAHISFELEEEIRKIKNKIK